MKTTYIYCSRCARVHERMPERRVGQDLMVEALSIGGAPVTRDFMDLLDHEVAKAVGIPVEFLRSPA
jgi:hypothetical protein